MTIKADHPAFMVCVDIRQAQTDCDKAGDSMEELDLMQAAVRIKAAQETLAKAAYNITLMTAQGFKKKRKTGPVFEPIPDYGDHMTFESFRESVENGHFVDYDGHGDLATADQCSNITINPSQLDDSSWKPPAWATHVVWYNK